jgi:chromosome segregation ATPase
MFQDSSLDFKLVQRVCLLQQALDQAKLSIEDMQEQLANHDMLQAHLAQTEEYSNVQQKIILNLKQQLAAKDQWQHDVLDQLLTGVRGLVADQHLELERLRVRVHQSQAEVQDYLVRIKNHYQSLSIGRPPTPELDLNSEVMIARSLTVSLSSQLQAARQHIQHLDSTLSSHQVTLARMQSLYQW